jgi:excinuclease ABC subunit A
MLKSTARSVIRLRGVRHNNLKNFDLDLPLNQLIVVTGLSGSGKSSLAFDTLFAEGQRRYIETFSPYARQFLDRMDKPQVDSIEGIPPAIAIEQRNAVKTTRSTVGTMTEICDYMKMLWPHVARLHCRKCGRTVQKEAPGEIWKSIQCSVFSIQSSEMLITFDLPLSEKLSLSESLALIAKQGFQRLLVSGKILRIDEVSSLATRHSAPATSLTVIQDRLRAIPVNRARFVEACEQAYHFGKGKLAIRAVPSDSTRGSSTPDALLFSNRLHCAQCDIEYREPTPALFSFNHPVGACPKCRGFGRVISIDYDLALPDRSKTIAEGVVKPWLTGHGIDSQKDLMRACRHYEIPTDVPFEKLPKKWQSFVIDGEPDYGTDEEHEWPRAWYGVKGYFRWLESKAYKMHVRVLLSRYRAYTPCPDCNGQRFQPDALLYKMEERRRKSGEGRNAEIASLNLADFYQLPIRDALQVIESLADSKKSEANDPLRLIFNEVRSRLAFLDEVGLGYVTLDRPTRSLSGGETERVNLTTCLGTRLVNTLFVLDEPSVGLHPRDTERLVRILQRLRDAGNTVVVVEHEASVMRAANQVVDLGPGHGATGGEVVFQGSFSELLKSAESITGEYLSGRRRIEIPERRAVSESLNQGRRRSKQSLISSLAAPRGRSESPYVVSYADGIESSENARALMLNDAPMPLRRGESGIEWLKLSNATLHNLKELSAEIPLNRFVCVTGVSGSGKTTLVREVLLPVLAARLRSALATAKASDRLAATDNEDADESDSDSAVGTPHSALLAGFEHLSRVILVDQSILGKTPRSNPAVYIGAFDDIREVFAQSELAKQRGLNASAFSFNSAQGQCERCRGAGFEKIEMQFLSDVFIRCPDCDGRRYREHILDVKISPESGGQSLKSARGAQCPKSIADLLEATVDEAIAFLAAFEKSRPAQRAAASLRLLQEVGLGYLKLGQPINTLSGGESQRLKLVRHLADAAGAETGESPTLFLFDEPTTGLHFDDVRVLLKVFQRLVDAGHSVVVIEHNLDVIKSADWVIDLGPEAGDLGGQIVAVGTPEQIAACEESYTGQALRTTLGF